MSTSSRVPRVMQSFPRPRRTTNPYIVQLDRALAAERTIEHVTFSWRDALVRRVDVLHLHWPEILLEGSSPARRWAKRMLLRALLLKLRLTRAAVVRTVHNLELPSGISPATARLLERLDAQVGVRIALNDQTAGDGRGTWVVIPHGHYRDWFDAQPRAEKVAGRIGYFGLIRRYKGVETLLDVYADAVERDDRLSLHVGGKPSSDELRELVEDAEKRLPHLQTTLRFLDDRELVEIASASELIVLPYRFMHNSGGALAALSLDRPVLVPRNAVNEALRDEVGAEWVHLYDGELDAQRLRSTLDAVGGIDGSPDLSAREWADAGARLSAVYLQALAERGAR